MEKVLRDSTFIGMASEWRPLITKRDTNRPALLQIGNKEAVFLIDLIALEKNTELDYTLYSLFTNDKTTCIGFDFNSALSVKSALKQMDFYQDFSNFVDVQDKFGQLFTQNKRFGLNYVMDYLFQKSICMGETMSNWERKPLRQSQNHHAALNAVCLIYILEKLDDLDTKKQTPKPLTRE